MHERSLIRAVLGQVERLAAACGPGCATRIELEIGPLSGVDGEALAAAFRDVESPLLAAEARLVIREIPLAMHCPRCDARYDAQVGAPACPVCGAAQARVVAGDGLTLVCFDWRSHGAEEPG